MKVKYIDCCDEQVAWGDNDDPRGLLRKGEVYEVEEKIVKSYHTKITLKEIDGKFNSVCFEEIN